MSNNVPITNGQGQSSVAAEEISSLKYQKIKVVDGTASSTNTWTINLDGSAQVSVVGQQGASVSGTVGASVIGWIPIQPSNTSIITVAQGSIAAVIVGGSVTAVITPAANQSVSGTVGASIVGQLPAGTATLGSIAALQGTNPWVVVSSLAGGLFPVTGSVAAVITNANVNVSGSVAAFITGSSSIITAWKDSSVLSVPVGSTIGVWQSPSIVGTYAEDAASATGDKGIFILGARNDTLSSVSSTDGDYTQLTVGPTGEAVVANSPITKWIRGTADLRVVLGSSVTAIAAQGASIFTYITGIQIANMGSASVLVTFGGGLGSILGYSIAPAGGGSNILYPNALRTGENSAFTASISGTASVLVSAQGFIAKI